MILKYHFSHIIKSFASFWKNVWLLWTCTSDVHLAGSVAFQLVGCADQMAKPQFCHTKVSWKQVLWPLADPDESVYWEWRPTAFVFLAEIQLAGLCYLALSDSRLYVLTLISDTYGSLLQQDPERIAWSCELIVKNELEQLQPDINEHKFMATQWKLMPTQTRFANKRLLRRETSLCSNSCPFNTHYMHQKRLCACRLEHIDEKGLNGPVCGWSGQKGKCWSGRIEGFSPVYYCMKLDFKWAHNPQGSPKQS